MLRATQWVAVHRKAMLLDHKPGHAQVGAAQTMICRATAASLIAIWVSNEAGTHPGKAAIQKAV